MGESLRVNTLHYVEIVKQAGTKPQFPEQREEAKFRKKTDLGDYQKEFHGSAESLLTTNA